MASIKIPTFFFLFCKHTVLYILHTKGELVVKGHSAPFCIFLLLRKPILGISDSIHEWLHLEVSIGNAIAGADLI